MPINDMLIQDTKSAKPQNRESKLVPIKETRQGRMKLDRSIPEAQETSD
jgi:hypothetical protein